MCTYLKHFWLLNLHLNMGTVGLFTTQTKSSSPSTELDYDGLNTCIIFPSCIKFSINPGCSGFFALALLSHKPSFSHEEHIWTRLSTTQF